MRRIHIGLAWGMWIRGRDECQPLRYLSDTSRTVRSKLTVAARSLTDYFIPYVVDSFGGSCRVSFPPNHRQTPFKSSRPCPSTSRTQHGLVSRYTTLLHARKWCCDRSCRGSATPSDKLPAAQTAPKTSVQSHTRTKTIFCCCCCWGVLWFGRC